MLLASVGDAKLMPINREGPVLVVTAKNGYTRGNQSWVIDRILRDYEAWMDPAVRKKLNRMLGQRHEYLKKNAPGRNQIPRPGQTGLCVSIYEPDPKRTAGTATPALTYWSGFAVAMLQMCIAGIPVIIWQDWSILFITGCGTFLAMATGSLPQWRVEKWPCRRGTHTTHILTRGNGAQHAIVILGNGSGLNLEDLAMGGQAQTTRSGLFTRICLGLLAVSWTALLITAAGVKAHSWFLLAVGGLGVAQNVLVAGWRCNPSSLGVHLKYREVFGEMATMDTLIALETAYPLFGKSLLPVFFPGDLLPEEVAKWEELRLRAESRGQNPTPPKPEGWIAHARTYDPSRSH
ncbi:hypothetical protein GJ744_002773 [Endocarpon pusillum]|uniref:Uncharacterized protein n=1 Tax=Endocarpon pusillum TaxID=364733 RepID=A0A8H7AVU1_9EURO|nr:hypothetical protein GJ744_002773 [Endocarpon pusillum]